MPTELVRHSPTLARMPALIRIASAIAASRPFSLSSSRHATSSIEQTWVTGICFQISATTASWNSTYFSCRAGVTISSRHLRFASHTGVPVEMPYFLASTDAAIATVVSLSTGATMTGLPRNAGSSCCSTLAK